jgi:hypothetical protein
VVNASSQTSHIVFSYFVFVFLFSDLLRHGCSAHGQGPRGRSSHALFFIFFISFQTYCDTDVARTVKGLEVDLLMNSAASYLKFPPLPQSPVSQDSDSGEEAHKQHPARLALVAIDRYLKPQCHIITYSVTSSYTVSHHHINNTPRDSRWLPLTDT